MNKKTIILIIIGFVLTILITIGITLAVSKSKQAEKLNSININESEKEKTIKEEKKDTNEEVDVIVEESKEEQPNEKEESKNSIIKDNSNNTNTVNQSTNNQSEITTQNTPAVAPKSEADIVSYVESIESTNTGNTLKNGFVTVIDFIFYGGEIYGKTFAELSNSAKIKIISLALKIDSKIDEYFPGYKETISNTTNRVYTSIKTKLVTLYLDTTVKICNNNPKVCEDAKQGLTELKTNFGITWDFIKDISGAGITKLKDWYEVWREE